MHTTSTLAFLFLYSEKDPLYKAGLCVEFPPCIDLVHMCAGRMCPWSKIYTNLMHQIATWSNCCSRFFFTHNPHTAYAEKYGHMETLLLNWHGAKVFHTYAQFTHTLRRENMDTWRHSFTLCKLFECRYATWWIRHEKKKNLDITTQRVLHRNCFVWNESR